MSCGDCRAVFYCTDGMAYDPERGAEVDAIVLHVEHWRRGTDKLWMTYERHGGGYEFGDVRRSLADSIFPTLASASN